MTTTSPMTLLVLAALGFAAFYAGHSRGAGKSAQAFQAVADAAPGLPDHPPAASTAHYGSISEANDAAGVF